jgi:hypothetical protein
MVTVKKVTLVMIAELNFNHAYHYYRNMMTAGVVQILLTGISFSPHPCSADTTFYQVISR